MAIVQQIKAYSKKPAFMNDIKNKKPGILIVGAGLFIFS